MPFVIKYSINVWFLKKTENKVSLGACPSEMLLVVMSIPLGRQTFCQC
jgi:hypothetical protein